MLAARTLRPVKEAVEAEQRFFANAAHDLRTPLAVMRSEAEIALRASPVEEADARKVLASSLEEIDQMSAMVEQVLDLARSGSPSAHARSPLVSLDLADLARNVAEKMSLRAQARGLRLTIDVSAAARVNGNPRALERAVFNILENAINYTSPGGGVRVRVAAHGSHVDLSVSDDGFGIAPEDLPHITEPFFRGDRSRGAHSGGTGLGLTIARSVVEELREESRLNEGTTVTLRLPLA
ncbi:MAG: sensor histidine kinase [Spirochaetia bacterium]